MTDTLRFVLCPPYHGATALAFLLNNHPRLSCLGDSLPWGGRNQSCSCGARVDECGFWQEIRRRVGTDRYAGEAQMLPLLPRLFPAPGANRIAARALTGTALVLGPWVGRIGGRAVHDYVDAYRRFYAAIAELQGTRFVVDGSKSIGKVLALTALDGIGQRAKVVHLVRDPRGYANSLQSRGAAPARLVDVGREWRRTHGNIQRLFEGRARFDYLRLRYEDLCLAPDTTMNALFDFFGVEPASVCHPARDPRKNHIIGNRMLKTFDGRLTLDTRWQTGLSAEDQAAVRHAADSLAAAYGYR
jgi:hypothetical protein